jgi:autophagy-related protein 9
MVVLVFEGAFSCYWFVTFVQYVYEIGGLLKIKHFFNNDLGISESDIQTILWSELVDKIVKVQETIPISRVKAKLDERDIVNLIMRKENYLIAFLNKKVVDLRLPFFGSKPILTETLLWNLRYIISSMFDENFYIKESIVSSPNDLRWKFIYLGMINIIAAPFVFVYLIVYIFFKYTAELRNSGFGTVFDRKWNTLAKWKFREFNELPHIFELRFAHLIFIC